MIFFFFFFCFWSYSWFQLDSSWGGVSKKDEERGLLLHCGESTKVGFLADDANSKWIWIDGLVLACNFETRMYGCLLSFVPCSRIC